MITMEFEEMKKIWDAQNSEPIYGINTQALHNRIISKRNTGRHITNVSELLWIIGNLVAGCCILGVSLFKAEGNTFMYLLAAWMISIGLYVLVSRIRRLDADEQFDRSMLGDLRYAISLATYQVRLSQLGRWNLLPVGLMIILTFWDGGKSVWWMVGLLIFAVITNYAAGWEHNIYKNRKRELEILQGKLESEEPTASKE